MLRLWKRRQVLIRQDHCGKYSYSESLKNHSVSPPNTNLANNDCSSDAVAVEADVLNNENMTGTEGDCTGFKGVERRRNNIKRFFLSGISERTTECQILANLGKNSTMPLL